RIVRPDAAVITSIGEEHLEKLGDLEGVLEEEIAILRGLPEDGVAMVAEEPAALPERAREILGGERVSVAGFAPTSALHPEGGADAIETLPDGTTRWRWNAVDIHLPLPGRWNVRNALLALGLALEWGVLAEEAALGVEGVVSTKLRGEWHQIGQMRVLADCYNSNPPSLRAALDLLASLPASGRKVAVVGTMRELGGSTDALHEEAARALADRLGDGIDLVVATGHFADSFQPLAAELGERLIACEDPVEAFAAAAPRLRPDDTLLLKASRGEALERWLDLLGKDD
ncbi:MAG TPA: Mur ligase family protein, partial [Longimicrobiaceae bacterium]|nr:Mur ligase family protein [Longimicrobiaceae bacterium]